jgi:hypothetical protein
MPKTLLDLKEKIEEDKVDLNKAQGQKEEALRNLKTKGVKNAKKELKKLEEEIEKDDKLLNKQIKNLSEKVEGNNGRAYL